MLQKNVGNERVLTALAQTMEDFSPVDLQPTIHAGGAPPAAAKAPHAPAGLESNSERYIERAEIGRGGLGVVLEAFDQDLRRAVALKRPRDDRMTDRAVVSLVAEAQITAQLDHPNIPAVHSLGIDAKGRPYFTMTRLHGSSLATLLDARRTDPESRKELSQARLLRIFLQVGYAVAFAHDRGVLHRDLKPDNIIVGDYGEVRLMDWGIAKVLDRPDLEPTTPVARGDDRDRPAISTSVDTPETHQGAFVGTPGYAPPEQVAGQKDLDERADVYALGALLYEMVAGRPPVVGETTMIAITRTLDGDIPPIKSLVPISDRLAAIIHMAVSTDRETRYESVLALLDDIEALLEGRPVRALDECLVERAGRWYMSRTPRMARLRNIDIDLLSWSAFCGGIAMTLLLGFLLPRWIAYPALAMSLLALVPPIFTMARKPRPDDPGYLLAFSEGSVSQTLRRTRSTDRTRRRGGPDSSQTS